MRITHLIKSFLALCCVVSPVLGFIDPIFITPPEKETLKRLEKKVLLTSLTNKENSQLERLRVLKKKAKLFKTEKQKTFQTIGYFGTNKSKDYKTDQAADISDLLTLSELPQEFLTAEEQLRINSLKPPLKRYKS